MWLLPRKLNSIIKHKTTRQSQPCLKMNVVSKDDSHKQKMIEYLNIEPFRDTIDMYRFKHGDENKHIVELIYSAQLPKDAESVSLLFICYDVIDRDYLCGIKDKINLTRLSCLFVGFKDNTISIITAETHSDIDTCPEDCSTLLKNQLLYLVANGMSSTEQCQKEEALLSKGIVNEELPFDIVDQMINDEQDDTTISIFLMLYRKFMTSIQLLQQLINHFEEDSFAKEPTLRQKKTLYILSSWLTCYWGDFHHFSVRHLLQDFLESLPDGSFYKALEELAFREPPKEDPDILWGIQDDTERNTDSGYYEDSFSLLDTKDEDQVYPIRRSISSQAYSSNELPTHKRYSIPEIHTTRPNILCGYRHNTVAQTLRGLAVKTMAEQLSLLEGELFYRIQPRDFLRHVWVHQKQRETPISAFIQHFNTISDWIASMIISQVDIEDRVVVYEYCLKIAVELEQLNNFNSLMAVLAGINSAAILRLKETRQVVMDRNQALVDTVSRLEKLMSSERSFYNYRYVLKQKANSHGIPYLGIHQQDLVSLCEANKDHKTNGKIHWQKFRLIGESIMEVIRFQYKKYDWIQPDPFVLHFIKNKMQILTEDERYELSIKIEPKPLISKKQKDLNHHSSRWLILKSMML